MITKIEQFLDEKAKLTKELQEWVVDKVIPLEERWNLFIKSGLGGHTWVYVDFDTDIGRDYCDDLEQKYETHKVTDVLSWAEDQEDHEKPRYTENQIIDFKESVLIKFIKSFDFDW